MRGCKNLTKKEPVRNLCFYWVELVGYEDMIVTGHEGNKSNRGVDVQ